MPYSTFIPSWHQLPDVKFLYVETSQTAPHRLGSLTPLVDLTNSRTSPSPNFAEVCPCFPRKIPRKNRKPPNSSKRELVSLGVQVGSYSGGEKPQLPLRYVGESSRGNTIRGNRTESLWEGNLPLRGSLREPLKNLWNPLKTSKTLWKPLETSENPPSQRPSQRQISLSEALGPVATIHLPLKLSPNNYLRVFWCNRWCHRSWGGTRPGVIFLIRGVIITLIYSRK